MKYAKQKIKIWIYNSMQDNVIFQKGRMTRKRMFGLLSIWFLVSDDLCTICFIEGYAIFTSRLLQGVNRGSNMYKILKSSYDRLIISIFLWNKWSSFKFYEYSCIDYIIHEAISWKHNSRLHLIERCRTLKIWSRIR